MTRSAESLVRIALAHLTDDERAGAVAYAAVGLLAAGTRLDLPGTVIETAAPALLAFVDGYPTANWGHPARYLIIDADSGAVASVAARLPPFTTPGGPRWRAVYQAPSVPNAAVAFPQ